MNESPEHIDASPEDGVGSPTGAIVAPETGDALPEQHDAPSVAQVGGEGVASRRWLLPVLAVACLIALGSLFVAFNATKKAAELTAPPKESSTTSVTEKPAPAGFTDFSDPATGFSISYPEKWERLTPPAEDIRLLLGAGGQDSLLVRVVRLEQPVTAANVADVKSFTDSVVSGGEGIKVLQERPVTIGGMPGYYYFYTFTDATTGTQGVHAHYFLFQGRKMNTLVFQALPSEGFTNLAPVFDQVAESFRSTPEDASADPAPTPSTTTAP